MLVCIVRNNLSGGLIIFDNVDYQHLTNNVQIYGVMLSKGERNPSGNVGIGCKRVPMLDMERDIFIHLHENRFEKTEYHDPTFSYFIRSW
jgi:hypothetical protein